MNELAFPFWIVTQRCGLISQPVEPEGMPGFIAAFTTAESAASFMVERDETDWEKNWLLDQLLRPCWKTCAGSALKACALVPSKARAERRSPSRRW